MKKTIIAVLLGTIVMFIYQALSWMILPTHENSIKYTDHQDAILQSMSGLEEGMYNLPYAPPGTSMSEEQKLMEANIGKPWAMMIYHPALESNMGKNMAIGFLINLVAVWFFVWLLRKGNIITMGGILAASLVVAIIVIFNTHLMNMNWFSYPMHFLWGEIIDTLVMWLLTGIAVGLILRRKTAAA